MGNYVVTVLNVLGEESVYLYFSLWLATYSTSVTNCLGKGCPQKPVVKG